MSAQNGPMAAGVGTRVVGGQTAAWGLRIRMKNEDGQYSFRGRL